MTFDPSGDFSQLVDGLQSVTLLRPGSSLSATVSHALCRAIRTREARPSDGDCSTSDVAWHLPAAELPEAPRLGDVIVDEHERRWTILAVRAIGLAARWRCTARDLALAHGLDETVRVEKAAYAKGESGAEEAVWRLWKTGVRAKIQPVAREAKTEHQRAVTASSFKVLVVEDLDIDHTCRIRGPDAKIYRVVSYRKAQRIDAPGEIEVELLG